MNWILLTGSLAFLLLRFPLSLSWLESQAKLPVFAQTPNAKKPASTPSPQVKLLSAGQAPRQKLSFNPSENSQQTIKVKVNPEFKSAMNGQPIPDARLSDVEMTIQTKVTKIEPNGNIHLEFIYSQAQISPIPGQPPQENRELAGYRGTIIVDRQGRRKNGNPFISNKTLDDNTKSAFEFVSSLLVQSLIPLPSEPIGVGGKWQVTQPLKVDRINLTQISTYKLVSRTANQVKIALTTQEQAKPQSIQVTEKPNTPSPFVLYLESHHAKGQGAATLNLNQVMPSNLTMNFQLERRMRMKMNNNPQANIMTIQGLVDFRLTSN
ncbi:hypothetical protein [Chroococcus sp. FPU101]|uniref:hypothetical protein n=1 Tax=Chroococcus sp. FPU101 TaxID=1974212 RepID=UPI001A8E5731|nr:hypothetical protein [Chroococcus sp. FPU101]GFE71951.1 hypothetical protein CFPU101_45610 [Chroococcus sp. FPU101]